ncbi:hypothetical protein GETHLI_01560 [Geothrix limicola]|uniref:TonB C-terminal domain-containing protein n=1 Tax=Geothrix limicola TaxID=2927978 RepID=A0ABQ5QC68_9BACT|nr:energy transducer TonB [Geothrix limicola]GLH71654.1 hypothetical protein GETHLI_01560 [Geothrix limicola]
MGNALASTVLSIPLRDHVAPAPASAPTPAPSYPAAASAGGLLAEPPALGTLPKGPRTRIWAVSATAYAGLLAAGVAMAVAPPRQGVPPRIVTLSLDSFEDLPAAPPPPAGGAETSHASAQPRAEEVAPVQPAVEALSSMDTVANPVPVLPSGSLSGGHPGGQPGGVTGGQVGGQAGGQFGGLVGGITEAVAPPRFDAAYLQNPEPTYPALSKRFGEEGRVILRVLVNPEGQPEQVEVRQSSGHARLDQAALGTVRRWRFTPARRGSERLAAWVLVPLSFQLDA